MKVLICHGYVLKGTGSNQYVQSLARAFCRLGCEVVVMCQEPNPDLDFVSSFVCGKAGSNNPEKVWERETAYAPCTVFKPDIGGLLPVYVVDSYPGFKRVEAFPDLDEEELGAYVEANRSALQYIIQTYEPDVIHVNHAVMLPYIVRPEAEVAGLPYFVTIHGSAIEFTVKRDKRFLEFGAEGLSGASGIIVSSEYSSASVKKVFGSCAQRLEDKLMIVPPGVNTDLFRPAERTVSESVEKLIHEVGKRVPGQSGKDMTTLEPELPSVRKAESIPQSIERINAARPDWLPEPDLDARLRGLAVSGKPFLMFVGKLLETKGVQCVLPAMPLVLRECPGTHLVIVGFGELRGILGLILNALDAGDLEFVKQLCSYGNRKYQRCSEAFDPILDFLQSLDARGEFEDYRAMCLNNNLAEAVVFTGYLTQTEHVKLLPHASALLVPSLAPEAFGLVATEAMACETVPIASGHSGLLAAMAPLEKLLGEDTGSFLLDPSRNLTRSVSAASVRMLRKDKAELKKLGAGLRKAVVDEFSWNAMGKRLISKFERATQP